MLLCSSKVEGGEVMFTNQQYDDNGTTGIFSDDSFNWLDYNPIINEPDDFEEFNRNEVLDYKDEG